MEERTSIGKISSLPASMSKISTSLENQEYTEKLQVGPTTSNPGPILLKHAACGSCAHEWKPDRGGCIK